MYDRCHKLGNDVLPWKGLIMFDHLCLNASAWCKQASGGSPLPWIDSMLWPVCGTAQLVLSRLWRMGHSRMVSALATAVGGRGCFEDSVVPSSKLASTPWSSSFITGITLLLVYGGMSSNLLRTKWYPALHHLDVSFGNVKSKCNDIYWGRRRVDISFFPNNIQCFIVRL